MCITIRQTCETCQSQHQSIDKCFLAERNGVYCLPPPSAALPVAETSIICCPNCTKHNPRPAPPIPRYHLSPPIGGSRVLGAPFQRPRAQPPHVHGTGWTIDVPPPPHDIFWVPPVLRLPDNAATLANYDAVRSRILADAEAGRGMGGGGGGKGDAEVSEEGRVLEEAWGVLVERLRRA